MFKFVLNKMLNKKWMVLSLLIGNILLIGAITFAFDPSYFASVVV